MAIFIIIIGLLGVLALISTSISSGASSTSRLIAANLAQEGIEVVKNLRDLSYETDGTWDNWHVNIPGGGSPYIFSVQYNSSDYSEQKQDEFLLIDSSGLYSYDSGVPTPFKREISLTKNSDQDVKVVSKVTWSEKGRPDQSIIVEDILWNWR